MRNVIESRVGWWNNTQELFWQGKSVGNLSYEEIVESLTQNLREEHEIYGSIVFGVDEYNEIIKDRPVDTEAITRYAIDCNGTLTLYMSLETFNLQRQEIAELLKVKEIFIKPLISIDTEETQTELGTELVRKSKVYVDYLIQDAAELATEIKSDATLLNREEALTTSILANIVSDHIKAVAITTENGLVYNLYAKRDVYEDFLVEVADVFKGIDKDDIEMLWVDGRIAVSNKDGALRISTDGGWGICAGAILASFRIAPKRGAMVWVR